MVARIYRPARTAMQSGKSQSVEWLLMYEPEEPKTIDPLMGYTSSGDMKAQIRLSFETKEEAVEYAERNGIPYRIEEPKEAKRRRVSYSDNFRYDRRQPWTH
ncbi:ETC complex I subunit [Mangrovicella endophytica]|uniref:ETC complex I subunit n=1 Tax=Mangrovicella endophytica TaxID=2066697 RepID=UPI0013000609|nr:ETC complex I subunit [Mangrovicella endophytica]